MSRFRTTSSKAPINPQALRVEVEGMVAKLKERGAEIVDGMYVLVTSIPVADGRVLMPARTKQQRKVVRMLAARGQFCGFYPAT